MSEKENNLFGEEFDLGSELGGFTVMDGDNPFGNDDFDLGSETKTDKERSQVVCKVTPSVTAKKKGFAQASYKGMFKTVDEAMTSQKAIGYVPSGDGLIYEVRRNKVDSFIAPSKKVSLLRKVNGCSKITVQKK